MAQEPLRSDAFSGPLKRLFMVVLTLLLIGVFILWRIDSPRVERFRMAVIDRVVPNLDWAFAPVAGAINLLTDFQSYLKIYEQNQELRRELQRMESWKEAALQLEQENARLLDLNNVRLDPRLTSISGTVLTDSGSPYRQSVLINVGARDGILDGWAAMDGIGLVGRVSGVGERSSRVLLLTDASSRVPVTIQPSGQRGLIIGDNTLAPPIDFVENRDLIRPGDRVVSSGDGDVFPSGVLIGHIAVDTGGRMRVRLAADYERLEFLRILRNYGTERISGTGSMILPETPPAPVSDASAAESGTND